MDDFNDTNLVQEYWVNEREISKLTLVAGATVDEVVNDPENYKGDIVQCLESLLSKKERILLAMAASQQAALKQSTVVDLTKYRQLLSSSLA